MRLVYEEMPETNSGREPLYMRYVPLVEEFVSSGKDSARVDDDECGDVTKLAARLRNAVSRSRHGADASVHIRKGSAYLVRGR